MTDTMHTPDSPETAPAPEPPLSLSQKFLLVAFGTGLALACGLLALFVMANTQNPGERSNAGTRMEVAFRSSDGDLFFLTGGRVRPIAPETDELLSVHVLEWDADGFRVPAQPAEAYPVAAFGDSFTEGANVAFPWPDLLAQNLGVAVRNYGFRGYGPREVLDTMREFAPLEPRNWLLYAYFSGNELMDTNRALGQETILRSPLALMPWLSTQSLEKLSLLAPDPSARYDYPVPVIIGPNYYELGFLDFLLWWQNWPDIDSMAASRTLSFVRDALISMSAEPELAQCRAFIFVPTKEQLYYPYVVERRWLREVVMEPYLREDGLLDLRSAPIADESIFLSRLRQHRDYVLNEAKSAGWYVIDLLEPFEAAVAQGELLYYPYDTHWNQAGHELAARVISETLSAVQECALT